MPAGGAGRATRREVRFQASTRRPKVFTTAHPLVAMRPGSAGGQVAPGAGKRHHHRPGSRQGSALSRNCDAVGSCSAAKSDHPTRRVRLSLARAERTLHGALAARDSCVAHITGTRIRDGAPSHVSPALRPIAHRKRRPPLRDGLGGARANRAPLRVHCQSAVEAAPTCYGKSDPPSVSPACQMSLTPHDVTDA